MTKIRIEIETTDALSDQDIDAIVRVAQELARAQGKFGPFRSAHEGYAILLEEVDELWEVVKSKGRCRPRLQEESIQVAAMALRFLVDIADKADPVGTPLLETMGELDRAVESRSFPGAIEEALG